MNTKSAFNFRIQQDKYNEVLKEADLKNKSINILELHQSIVSPSFSVKENKLGIGMNSKLQSQEESKSLEKDENNKINSLESININFSNSAIKVLSDKHKKEVSDLKSYILKLNSEIRNSGLISDNIINDSTNNKLQDYISELKDIEKYKSIFTGQNNELGKIYDSLLEDLVNKLKETCKKITNPEYMNPIIELYERKIAAFEKENKSLIKAKNDLEKTINEYIEENSYLREENIYYKNENVVLMNGIVKGGDKNVIYTEEYVKQLEERLNLLSKENQIMGTNYQKAVSEFFDYKMKFNNSYQEFLNKNSTYDKLLQDNAEKNRIIDQLSNKLLVTENKLFEISDLLARHEIFKENCISVQDKLQAEVINLKNKVAMYNQHFGDINEMNNFNKTENKKDHLKNHGVNDINDEELNYKFNQISKDNIKGYDRYEDDISNNRNKTSIENVNINRLSNTDFINMD